MWLPRVQLWASSGVDRASGSRTEGSRFAPRLVLLPSSLSACASRSEQMASRAFLSKVHRRTYRLALFLAPSASGKVRDQRDSALWDQLAEANRSKHVAWLFYAPAAHSAELRTIKHGLPTGVKELQFSSLTSCMQHKRVESLGGSPQSFTYGSKMMGYRTLVYCSGLPESCSGSFWFRVW